MSSLGDYVSLVVEATVRTGIMRQIEAFRSGFNQVCSFVCFSLTSLSFWDILLVPIIISGPIISE